MANATKRIDQFYQNHAASSNMKFLIYDPTQSDPTKQDQIVAFNLIQQLLTSGFQITISGLMTSVNNLTTQVAGKVDQSAVGVTVAPAVGGIVPPANLPFSLSSLVGTWDASANTPTLSDGTGVNKTAYLVSVDGSQNLGSGVINAVAGNVLIHLGGTWQLVNSATVLGVTTINGTLTGNVDLDTSIVTPVGDFQFVTANMLAGLAGTSGIVSGSNKVVTNSDPRLNGLNPGASANPLNSVSKYEVNGIPSGTGVEGFMTLSTLGISSGAAAALFPATFAEFGTIPNGSITYDSMCIYEALLQSRNNGLPNLHFTGKTYSAVLSFGDSFPLPHTLTGVSATTGSLRFSIFGYGCSIRLIGSGAGKRIFQRRPSDEVESQAIAPYSIWIDGFKFQGDSDPNFIGIDLCSTKNSKISNCIFRNFGTGISAMFCLSMTLDTNRYFGCIGRSILLSDGSWSGATSSTSTTQASCKNQYITVPLAAKGIEVINSDSCGVDGGVFENSVAGSSAIYWQNTSTTVVKNFWVTNLHIEQAYTEAFLEVVAQDCGSILVENCFNQNSVFLIKLTNISGTNRMIIRNINKATNQRFKNSGGAGGAFSLSDVKMNNNPSTPTEVIDALNNIFDLTGGNIAPLVGRVKLDALTN